MNVHWTDGDSCPDQPSALCSLMDGSGRIESHTTDEIENRQQIHSNNQLYWHPGASSRESFHHRSDLTLWWNSNSFWKSHRHHHHPTFVSLIMKRSLHIRCCYSVYRTRFLGEAPYLSRRRLLYSAPFTSISSSVFLNLRRRFVSTKFTFSVSSSSSCHRGFSSSEDSSLF